MPFISSVSGALGGLLFPLPPLALPPIIVMSSTTNFNQDRATFNATVTPNGATTSVKFQYSTNATTWTDGATVTGLTGIAQSVYSNQTGLSPGTFYYVRAIATNSSGSTTSSLSTTFTTWSLQVYERTTSGGTTFTIPTVTPTGGSAVAVSIYDIIMFGGGGGAFGGGGGGGGYVSQSSASLSGNRSITTSVGGAGANENNASPTNGGSSTISGDITTLTATGGYASPSGSSGGTSGNGNGGGASASYDWAPNDKFGYVNQGFGGGGGAGGAGGSAVANSSGTYGGNGGSGVSITRGDVTVGGGAGGAGGATALDGGPQYAGARGSNNSYGSGGNGNLYAGASGAQPQGGYIRFRYYASSALA